MSTDDSPVSLNRHLFDRFRSLTNPDLDAAAKTQVAQSFEPFLDEIDGHLSFGEGRCAGQLPVLEWNTQFRKAYTLLLWIRPRMGGELETTVLEDDQNMNHRRILYRFATSTEDASSVGVCAMIGDWRVVEDDNGQRGEHCCNNPNIFVPYYRKAKRLHEKT